MVKPFDYFLGSEQNVSLRVIFLHLKAGQKNNSLLTRDYVNFTFMN